MPFSTTGFINIIYRLKIGGINPITTKLLIKLNKANEITINPAVLKNIPDLELFFILNELKLISANTGNVPRAKVSMVNPPLRKLPVERVYICID